MVDVATALSWTFMGVGAILFFVLKFVVASKFKGWKGMIAKFVLGIVLSVAAAAMYPICPSISVALVFAVIIIGGLFGVITVYVAQYIPFVGGTISFALSIVSAVIIVWVILSVIDFILDIVSIVALFVPIAGWIVDIIIPIVQLLIPIIQLFVAWEFFASSMSGIADCILGIERTSAIPGTGGIAIGAVK